MNRTKSGHLSLACAVIVATAFFLALPKPARATFHLWQIDEVYSSADGTVQFIEFENNSDFENFLTNSSGLTSNANNYTFTTNLSSTSTTNKHFLVGTVGYASIAGVPAPDYTVPNQFFSAAGDTLTLVGSLSGTITFTGAQLPTDGLNSLNRLYNGSTNSGFTSALNSPTNFAGNTGSVPEPTGIALVISAGAILFINRRRRTAFHS